jgi:hypothetical protein
MPKSSGFKNISTKVVATLYEMDATKYTNQKELS